MPSNQSHNIGLGKLDNQFLRKFKKFLPPKSSIEAWSILSVSVPPPVLISLCRTEVFFFRALSLAASALLWCLEALVVDVAARTHVLLARESLSIQEWEAYRNYWMSN